MKSANFCKLLVAGLLVSCLDAAADWHYGTVLSIYYGYDGLQTTFTLTSLNKTACTCYPTWPNNICLNRSRVTYKEEAATLLISKMTNKTIAVNIDEASCTVIAFGVPAE